jgi:hypothetical protein
LEDIVLVCWWPLICQLSNYNTSKTNHWFEKDLATCYQAKAHQVLKDYGTVYLSSESF